MFCAPRLYYLESILILYELIFNIAKITFIFQSSGIQTDDHNIVGKMVTIEHQQETYYVRVETFLRKLSCYL